MRSKPRLLLLLTLASVGCESPTTVDPDASAPELVCEPATHRSCDCPVGSGAQDCDVHGMGWGACICPIQSAVLTPDALAVDVNDTAIVVDDTGLLRFPRAGHGDLAAMSEGDVLVNWGNPPLLRRLTSAPRIEGDDVVVETRIAALEEAFTDLDVHLDEIPLNLYGALPEQARSSFEIPRAGIAGGPSGLTFSASGNLMPRLSFSDDSRVWFEPVVDADLHVHPSLLHGLHVTFDFSADLDAGLDLTSTAGLQLEGTVSAEIELIEAILANVVPPIRPPEIRMQIGPLYFAPKLILGCELEVNGDVELTSNVHASFDLGAQLSYDNDRDGDNWDHTTHASISGGAELLDFQWEAGATLTCYIRPRLEMTFLEALTGYAQAGPEIAASLRVGPENVFSVDAAVVGTLGAELGYDVGEIEVTIEEREWEVYRESTNLYREEFTICGDGYRQEGDGDDFREECDRGLVSDPNCNADCHCAEGWVPVAFSPTAPLSTRSFGGRPTQNICVPSCGNGAVEPDEGEVCDPAVDGRRCGVGIPGCLDDCSRMEGVCGDGIVDSRCGEVCDDGNTNDCDSCSSDCMRTRGCGNGLVDWACGESCDDGNTVNDDACPNTCRDPLCGNGIVDPREGCDDGNFDDCDACHNDCTENAPRCGDFHVCGDETCDVGGVDTWDCDSDCTRRECNDGHLNRFEQCEGYSETCDGDCTLAFCGDGTINALRHEDCDGEDWSCDADCTFRECGDGTTNPFAEVCDDGPITSCGGTCTADCQMLERLNTCGDGIVGCDELCDDGTALNGTCGHCGIDCHTRDGVCGDGEITLACGEICDDGNTTSGDGCASDCRGHETCGDGRTDPGEACDDADPGVCHGTCNDTCTGLYPDVCGDGRRTPCEACEDSGNGIDTGCTAAAPNCAGCAVCAATVCGDGVVEGAEVCEPSGFCNADEARVCMADTQCASGDTCRHFFYEGQCNESCTRIIRCGDGIPETGESCDDGNTVSGDGCSSVCTPE